MNPSAVKKVFKFWSETFVTVGLIVAVLNFFLWTTSDDYVNLLFHKFEYSIFNLANCLVSGFVFGAYYPIVLMIVAYKSL